MLSRPEGCANALTNVIAESAERGPGSAAKYSVGYDGARIVMTVLSWRLESRQARGGSCPLCELRSVLRRSRPGIPITTTELSGVEKGGLAYQQTMRLNGSPSSVYMAFINVGKLALFGIAFPTPDPRIEAKASLPQTFLDVVAKQAAKIRAT